MTIRNGNYTKLDGYDCALFEVRQEAPIPFTHFIVKWYSNQACPLEGFKLNEHGDLIRVFERGSITNSYSVKTIGKYKDDEFWLWSYNESRNIIGLITHDIELAKKYHFFKLSDRYIKEVDPKELDSIWEERGENTFGLPMTTGIKKKMIIGV